MEVCNVCGGKGFYFRRGKQGLSEKRIERMQCRRCEGRGLIDLAFQRPYDNKQLLKEEKTRVTICNKTS
jgi:DnaJ-class molecular chaperone